MTRLFNIGVLNGRRSGWARTARFPESVVFGQADGPFFPQPDFSLQERSTSSRRTSISPPAPRSLACSWGNAHEETLRVNHPANPRSVPSTRRVRFPHLTGVESRTLTTRRDLKPPGAKFIVIQSIDAVGRGSIGRLADPGGRQLRRVIRFTGGNQSFYPGHAPVWGALRTPLLPGWADAWLVAGRAVERVENCVSSPRSVKTTVTCSRHRRPDLLGITIFFDCRETSRRKTRWARSLTTAGGCLNMAVKSAPGRT